jgi:hypothetical protein
MLAKRLCCLYLFVMTGLVFGQAAGTGTLVGTVTDASGAIMVGAKVTTVNVDTSFTSEAVTNSEGAYSVPYLAPGMYRLTIETPGFKKYLRSGLQIRTQEIPRVDVVLEVGAVGDTVTVEGSAPLLETETSAAGQVLSGEQLLKIPVSQKRAIRMTYYYPGTQDVDGYHVLGQRARSIAYTVDGINGKEPGIGNVGGTNEQISTTQDAFQEVKILTTGTPAEYGHAAGGMMSIVFKSGTNQFHGSAENRHIGKEMIHRAFLEQLPRTNPFSYNETSFLFTGPLTVPKIYNGKDKTFWLVGWEQHAENAGTAGATTTVPTDAMYNGDFTFGGQSTPKVFPVYDPFSTRQVNGTYTRDAFAGNLVPKSRFDPSVQKFLALNPFTRPNQPGSPGATGPTLNLLANQVKQIRRIRWDIKIDQQFSSNHRIYGRYSQAHHRAWRGDHQAQFAWLDIDPNAQPNPVEHYNGVISDIYIINPTMSNEFRGGFNRRENHNEALLANQDYASKFGIPNVSGATFPFFNIGYGLTGQAVSQGIGEDITLQDNVTKTWANHTFKFGYELIRTRYNGTAGSLPGGQYNFGGTELPFTPNTGQPFAAFLLGSVSSATFTQEYASWLPRWWSHQGYFQDDWKIRRNLTLNLGLRYSYETPFQTKYGQQAQFDPTAKDPLTGLTGAITHPKGPLSKNDWNNFAPRVGVAWNFHPDWVFRTSFGMIHQDIQAIQPNINYEEYVATATIQAPTGDPTPAFRLSNGPPAFKFNVQPDGSVPFIGTNYSTRNARWLDPNLRMPYVMSWSGGLQWSFRKHWLLDAQYQGQSGVGLLNSWDINRIPLNISKDAATLNTISNSSQNYKPYPQFGAVNLISNFGHNTYHGGTIRIEKRYSSGLSMNTFYTFERTITDADNETGVGGVDYYNRSLEKAVASYNISHRFVHLMSYELPFGSGRQFFNKNRFVDQVIGGWELTWTQTLQSGLPFTAGYANSPNRYLPTGSQRPNLLTTTQQAQVQNWNIGANRFPTAAQNRYLNFASFDYPAAFTAGTLGRDTFIGPGLNWTQLSLAKAWTVRERFRFQLRMDANNFPFKQPQFANPNATFDKSNPGPFARFTSTRGAFSDIGTANSNLLLVLKASF